MKAPWFTPLDVVVGLQGRDSQSFTSADTQFYTSPMDPVTHLQPITAASATPAPQHPSCNPHPQQPLCGSGALPVIDQTLAELFAAWKHDVDTAAPVADCAIWDCVMEGATHGSILQAVHVSQMCLGVPAAADVAHLDRLQQGHCSTCSWDVEMSTAPGTVMAQVFQQVESLDLDALFADCIEDIDVFTDVF